MVRGSTKSMVTGRQVQRELVAGGAAVMGVCTVCIYTHSKERLRETCSFAAAVIIKATQTVGGCCRVLFTLWIFQEDKSMQSDSIFSQTQCGYVRKKVFYYT